MSRVFIQCDEKILVDFGDINAITFEKDYIHLHLKGGGGVQVKPDYWDNIARAFKAENIDCYSKNNPFP